MTENDLIDEIARLIGSRQYFATARIIIAKVREFDKDEIGRMRTALG
jgi:hypothetical protein